MTETAATETATILVVDDAREIRIFLRRLLEHWGHRVLEACNGREGLERYEACRPDIVLTDLEMPEMGGLALIAALREKNHELPIIVISGKGTLSDAITAMRHGAWDYLVKPIREQAELEITIGRALERLCLLHEHRHYHERLEEEVHEKTRELRESKMRYQRLLESVTGYVYTVTVMDGSPRHTVHRSGCEKITGFTIEDFNADPALWYQIVHEEDRPLVLDMAHRVLAEPANLHFEHRIRHRDGTLRWVKNTLVPCLDKSGTLRSYDGIISDITEQKQSEEQSRRHMDRLAALRLIDETISGSLNLQISLNVFLQETLKQLKVDAACVLLLDPHSQMLEYTRGQGFHTEVITRARVRIGESLAGRVARERTSIVINDMDLLEEGSFPGDLVREERFRAYVGVPLIAKGQVRGIYEIFHRAPLQPDREWLDYAEALAGQGAIALDNAELFENLQNSHSELMLAYDTTIEGWSRALDYRDKETEGHSKRVTELTVQLASRLGISKEKLVHIRRGALLHDIGKLGVPDCILLKPGTLTPEEFDIMKRHTEIAFRILYPIEFLRPAMDIPYLHHERWDGSGYPHGLRGEEIPLAARIFAVVDVWDALRSDRPYRTAWGFRKALDYIREQAGVQFDPGIVSLFIDEAPSIRQREEGAGNPAPPLTRPLPTALDPTVYYQKQMGRIAKDIYSAK